MTSSSGNSSRLLKKISTISSRPRAFRVAVLGQNGVGKTALCVRFLTRRFIGDYDPFLERVYTCQRTVEGATVDFEVWDTAGLNENSKFKAHIRWADAIVLMYDITDRCSFNECSRLKFLVNAHSRRSRSQAGSDPDSELSGGVPVAMVANKKDMEVDRMVMETEGKTRSSQLNCVSFTEISAREDIEDVMEIFQSLNTFCKQQKKTRFLSLSKSTLTVEKALSSSEDEGTGDAARADEIANRRATFSSNHEIMNRRAKSRRRESFYTAT